MAELSYRKLSEDEIAAGLSEIDGWVRVGDELVREMDFDAYKDGVVFTSAVAYVADSMDHHPDIHLGYKRVVIRVSTHSVGGLSPYDLELARRIDRLL